jgi:hypothetical protein
VQMIDKHALLSCIVVGLIAEHAGAQESQLYALRARI